jgi:hypothetical protein
LQVRFLPGLLGREKIPDPRFIDRGLIKVRLVSCCRIGVYGCQSYGTPIALSLLLIRRVFGELVGQAPLMVVVGNSPTGVFRMRKNTKSTLMGLAAGLAVASVGTAGSLYATPVTLHQSVVATTLADTVPVKDTTRPKQDTTPQTTPPTKPDTALPTVPTTPKPDTTKPTRDTTPKPMTAVKP